MRRTTLSKPDRRLAIALAVTWVGAGVVGAVRGALHASLPLLVVSLLVAAWGAVWAAVGWRGRLFGMSPGRAARRAKGPP